MRLQRLGNFYNLSFFNSSYLGFGSKKVFLRIRIQEAKILWFQRIWILSTAFILIFCSVLMVERGSVSSVSSMQRAGDVTNYQSMDQTSSQINTEIFDRIWRQQV